MNFSATVDGLTFDQPDLFDAHMQATKQHKGIKGAEITRPMAPLSGDRAPWFGVGMTGWHGDEAVVKMPRLHADEKVWLGAWVFDKHSERTGQVWCLSFTRGYLWMIVAHKLVERSYSELELLADRDIHAELFTIPVVACATCGEQEGSAYRKECCWSDNMIEA